MKKRITLKLTVLFSLVAALILTAGIVAATAQPKDQIPEYIGSQACLGCHADKYANWQTSGHAEMVVPILNTSDLPVDIKTASPELQAELKKATYMVAGSSFMARDPETQHYITLKVSYNKETKQYVASKGGSDWSTGCAGCHTTNMDTPKGTWGETGIGCEACHGPGRDHALGKGDVSKITVSKSADVCGQCHGGNDRLTGGKLMADGTKWVVGYRPAMKLSDLQGLQLTKVDPEQLPPDPNKNHLRNYNMWAASAHGNSVASVASSDHATAECYTCHTAEGMAAKEAGQTLDISHKENLNPISCVVCHDPHNTGEEYQLKAEPEKVCIQCHANEAVAPGMPAKAGSSVYESNEAALKGFGAVGIKETPSFHSDITCQTCHMTEGNHLFKVIRPDDPNLDEARVDSCTQCHKDSSKEVRGALLEGWQSNFDKRVASLNTDMATIAAALKANPNALSSDLKAKYDATKTNLSIIVNDGSHGAHNFEYAMKILSQGRKDIDAVKAGLR